MKSIAVAVAALSSVALADISGALPGISGSVGANGVCGNIFGLGACIQFPHIGASPTPTTFITTKTETLIGVSSTPPSSITSWTSTVTITSTGTVIPVLETSTTTDSGTAVVIKSTSSSTLSSTTTSTTSSSTTSSSTSSHSSSATTTRTTTASGSSSSTSSTASAAAAPTLGREGAFGVVAGLFGAALLV